MQPSYTNQVQIPYGAPLRRPLRVNNVVRRLNLPDRTVRYLAQTGRLPAFKLDGKSWGFWPEDVDAFKCVMEADNAEVM
jgi:excisionase family DNA binding protein